MWLFAGMIYAALAASPEAPTQENAASGIASLLRDAAPVSGRDVFKAFHLNSAAYNDMNKPASPLSRWGISYASINLDSAFVRAFQIGTPPSTEMVQHQEIRIYFNKDFCISADMLEKVSGIAYQPAITPPTMVHDMNGGVSLRTDGSSVSFTFKSQLQKSSYITMASAPTCMASIIIEKEL